MRISDEERREVAQKLRSLNPSDTYKLCDGDFIDLLSETLGVDTDQLCYDAQLIKRLADLIDRPIVASHYVATPVDTSMLITGHSSQQLHCGNYSYTITRSYRYCPQCGVELKK